MRFLWTRAVLLACCLGLPVPAVQAQITASSGDEITITDGSATVATGDAISIPAGANGVTINNPVGGVITTANPTGNAIITNALDTTVNNAGEIFGGFNAVNFATGSSGSLDNSGTITSDSRGVNIDGLGGFFSLVNSGDILGTDDQRNGAVYSDSDALDFSTVNSGTIDSGLGNQGSGVAWEILGQNIATLTNSGTITGRTVRDGIAGNVGLSGDGLRLNNFTDPAATGAKRIASGDIVNEATGVIQSIIENDATPAGVIAGFRVSDTVGYQGTFDNAGLITGPQNGVYFGNGDHTGGVFNNTGDVTSASRAFNLDGTGLTVNNSGSILGLGNQRNGTFYADGTAADFAVNNEATGVIDAGEGNTGSGFGAEIGGAVDGANTFSLTNAGTIQGRGNANAATNAAGDGVRIGNVGNVGVAEVSLSNSGLIDSEGANGTVAGVRFVNGISFAGELNNSGVISGVQNGLYFGNPVNGEGADHSDGVVNNSGVISSGSRALNIDGLGLTVNNTGAIVGAGNRRNGTVYADATAQDFTLNNEGLIDAGEGLEGAAFSVELDELGNTFAINNSGDIVGRGNASAGAATAGDGLRFERTRVDGSLANPSTGLFDGEINNSGTISSEGANGTVGGVRFVNGTSFQGTLNNTGTISGVQNGVYFGNPTAGGGGDHTGGVVNNLGTIVSDSRALNLDGIGLTVNNAGDIVGSGRQRNGTLYVDGTGTGFTINNLAGGVIDAGGAGGEGSGVSIQVGTSATSLQTGSLTNAGVIAGAGDTELDAGLRLFAPTAGATFQGTFVNEVSGLISAEGHAPAILVEEGVVLDGAIINNGQIDGGLSVASGDVLLGDTSVVTLDIGGLLDGEFETIDVADTLEVGGVLNIVFHDLFNPAFGDTFDLINAGELIGGFSDVITNGVLLDTSDLLVGGTVTVVPEPATFMLLAGMGGVLLAGRRRA